MRNGINRLYHVVCLDDDGINWVMATSKAFTSHAEACEYATTVANSRMATVIEEIVPSKAEQH